MEKTFYTKENQDLNIMDLVNLGIVVLISLKNTIIFFLVFFLLIGFLSTSDIQPQYSSTSRLLIELPNINLKDEQNIDFSSLNIQAIQTEIEKIKSNTLLHNVIINNSIVIPEFKISRNNSSFITYSADRILSFSGLRFVIGLFQSVTSTAAQKAIETTMDITLDTIITSVDEEKVSDVSDKIRNEFKLTEQQNKKLDVLQEKFKNEKPDSEEVMSFAYGVLSNNDYSNQDILELAKNYLPDSISLSDDMLLKLIEKYKDEYLIDDLNTNSSTSFSKSKSSTTNMLASNNESSLVNSELNFNNTNNIEQNQNNKNIVDKVKMKLDYFERTNSIDFDLQTIRWLRDNLTVVKEIKANVLSISFTSIDPKLSKLIANAISEEYMNYQRISKESAGLYSTEYYQEKIDELREKQDDLGNTILDFESANDIYDSKVENLELDLREIDNEIKILEDEKNELSQLYTLKHPEVVTLLSKIETNNRIEDQLNDEISISRIQLSRLNKLNSELQVNETLLSTYLNKLLTVSSFNESDARILEKSDNALLVNSRDAIKKIISYLIAWLIISIIFIAIVIFLDFYGLFNKFQINSQIKDKTGIDSLGVIPHFSNLKLNYPIKFDLSKNKVVADSIKKIIFHNIN